MKKDVQLVDFDGWFIECYFESHNDFMRKTGMNRSTFYARLNNGWMVRFRDDSSKGRIKFDLLKKGSTFDVQA